MPPSEFEVFVDSLGSAIDIFLGDAKKISQFKTIYNKGMAAYNVLNEWSYDNPELLGAAAGAARRVVALICIRQYSLVNVELRRFMECIIWYAYFTDHLVEWETFKGNPSRSWKKRPEKPIETAANAPTNYYFRYIQERMVNEKSGLALSAISVLRNEYDSVSNYIHGAQPAMQGTLARIYDRQDPKEIQEITSRCSKVFKSGSVLIAAMKTDLLDNLNTTHRTFFDKLVAPSTASKIRNGPFGL